MQKRRPESHVCTYEHVCDEMTRDGRCTVHHPPVLSLHSIHLSSPFLSSTLLSSTLVSSTLLSSLILSSTFLFSLSSHFPYFLSLPLSIPLLCSLPIISTFPHPLHFFAPLHLLSSLLNSYTSLHIFNILWLTLQHHSNPLHITSFYTGSPGRTDRYKHGTEHTA